MTDYNALLASLRRPRILIRAARIGQSDYARSRDLRRLLRTAEPPLPARAVEALLAEEADLEAARVAGDARYSIARHVDVLIALLAEARALAGPPPALAAE